MSRIRKILGTHPEDSTETDSRNWTTEQELRAVIKVLSALLLFLVVAVGCLIYL